MAVLASPCPGNSTRSAFVSCSASSVRIGCIPSLFSPFITDLMLHALYFTIATSMQMSFHIFLTEDDCLVFVSEYLPFYMFGYCTAQHDLFEVAAFQNQT